MAKRKDGKPRAVINMTDDDRKALRDIGREFSHRRADNVNRLRERLNGEKPK